MSHVKGTPIKSVRVIEYRMHRIVLSVISVVALVIAALVACYFWGFGVGMSGQRQALDDLTRISDELNVARAKADEFEQLFENSRLSSEVDRKASEDVRKEVLELKDEVARLGEENNFYKSLMAPSEKASGLTLGAVELIRARNSDHYEYRIVVQQLAKRHELLKGNISIIISGRQNDIATQFPLMVLSDDVTEERIKLRFKYFQVIEGRLSLPLGFEPEGLMIEARSTGKNAQTVSKKFGWLVEEV
jgi:hypothetical protein